MGTLAETERRIPRCRRCPRLAGFLAESRTRNPGYWNRPVPGFGDRRAWLVIVGLAPGMHGANRTGRPFQGDASGEWLYGSLGRAGLWDGERLRGAYIVNAVKCVPPANKPVAAEMDACRPWLVEELAGLDRARVVIALGRIAHQAVLRTWGMAPLSAWPFAHGGLHRIAGRPPLLSSYHPSRQNTNTGTLTRTLWGRIWSRAARFAPEGPRR
ncbi:MAG: uracil-DNA glycosylase [Myxococcales bacterium]|nr:uracil-DNA glycosylase [Myxococcales bacterium]